MKIGAFLYLETVGKFGKKMKFRSKIIEKDNQYIYIDIPVNEKTKKTKFIPPGTHVHASFVGEDQSVYHFKTAIKGKTTRTVPALLIEIPEENQLTRIQRRQYVRIEVPVDVAIHSKDSSFNPFTTVTVDISGGGLSIIIPKGVSLQEGDEVVIWMVLHRHSDNYQYLKVDSEIVRIIERENRLKIGSLKFTSISTNTRQKIIQFCFEKQREIRQKEVQ